jgi:hypothetical protein
MGKGCIIRHKIKISINSGKDSTSTLSLVIHRVRLKKSLQKKYVSIQGGAETEKTIKTTNFDGS